MHVFVVCIKRSLAVADKPRNEILRSKTIKVVPRLLYKDAFINFLFNFLPFPILTLNDCTTSNDLEHTLKVTKTPCNHKATRTRWRRRLNYRYKASLSACFNLIVYLHCANFSGVRCRMTVYDELVILASGKWLILTYDSGLRRLYVDRNRVTLRQTAAAAGDKVAWRRVADQAQSSPVIKTNSASVGRAMDPCTGSTGVHGQAQSVSQHNRHEWITAVKRQ